MTTEQEAQVLEMLAAYTGAKTIADLPNGNTSNQDKSIEVYNNSTGQSEQMPLQDAVTMANRPWCGRVWNLENGTPVAATTIGSLEMLRNLQSLYGIGCYLVKNDHSRRKLDAKDHYKFATGEAAKLDGTMGHYQWGWGKNFYVVVKTVGNLLYLMTSQYPIQGEYNYFIPIASMSAMGNGVMDRTNSTLVSYVNEDAQYRGGNNNADWDGTYLSLLGMVATNMNAATFLTAARKNGDGWLGGCGRIHAVMTILYMLMFGNRNIQAAYVAEKDSNGLYQGGLGAGVSTIPDWGGYNGYNPMIPTSAGIELGDACGVVNYEVKASDGTTYYTAPVPVFCGLKHPFGHIWKIMTDECYRANADTSLTHLVATSLLGSGWTLADETGMTAYSTSPAADGWIKTVSLEHLELVPTSVGGSETTYYCDYFWHGSATSGLRWLCRGGVAHTGSRDGLSCVVGSDAVTDADASCGSPLCEIAEEWPLEPKYCEVA